jgi:hypothetical protein
MVIQVEMDKLTELIINAIPVEQIFLFGSYAHPIPKNSPKIRMPLQKTVGLGFNIPYKR